MKPVISIIKEENETHYVFDANKAIIIHNKDYYDTCMFIEGMEDTTIKGFHISGLGKWRWRIIQALIKLFTLNAKRFIIDNFYYEGEDS